MNRKIILLAAFSAVAPCLMAQGGFTDSDARLLDECRTLFARGDYSAAGNVLARWDKGRHDLDATRTEEIDFMRAVITAETDLKKGTPALQGFLLKYPNSIYSNRVMAESGSVFFAAHEYKNAILCFDETDPMLLDDDDCERTVRHYAISLLRCGRIEEGALQLNVLDLMSDDSDDQDLLFYHAFTDYHKGDLASAKEGFSRSLEGDHADESRLYLADIALKEKSDDGVLDTAQEFVTGSDDQDLEIEAERIMGQYCYNHGDYARAAELMTSYMLSGKSADVEHDNYILGMSCYRTGDWDGAIKALSGIAQGEGELAQNAALHQGLAALEKGDMEMARMSFERSASLPGRSDAAEQALFNYAMAVHESSYSPFAESVTVFERFLNEYPNSKYTDKVNSYLVDAYLSTPSYDVALASIDKLRNPGQSILAAKMQLLFRKAMDKFAAGEYAEVPGLLTGVIDLDRYDHNTAVEAFFWRAESYYRNGSFRQAETDYSRYIAQLLGTRKGYYALACYGLGYIRYNNQVFMQAYENFSNAIESAATSGLTDDVLADACLRAGDCMFYMHQYGQARDYYSRSLDISPETGDYALYQTALVDGLEHDYYGKVACLDTLVSVYPQSAYIPHALYEEGRAYQQMDRPEQAVSLFRRILDTYPTSDLARKASAEIALIYYQTDRYDEAISAYKDVVAMYPGSDEAATAMVDLKSIYVGKGDINSYLEYAQSVQGASPIAVSERDSLTYAAAESLYGKGENDAALFRFTEYLERFPQGAFAVNAWYYQGILAQQACENERALDCFLHVMAYENSRFCEEALDRAATLAWQIKDYETAMDTYIRLVERTTNVERQSRGLYGIVASAGQIEEYDAVLQYADQALNARLTSEQKTEVTYWKAKALIAGKQPVQARPLLEQLAADTRSQFGAESAYLLSQILYDSGDADAAQKNIMSFIQEGTPHMYWLARSFILLSDIYKSQGKDIEARQYLLSLQQNYTEKDDIAEMIAKRLE